MNTNKNGIENLEEKKENLKKEKEILESELSISSNESDKEIQNNKKIRERLNILNIMENYFSEDKKLRQKAINDMIILLDKYIYYVMYKKFSSYIKDNKEDLYAEGVCGIIEAMKKFDPTKGAPTTFFNIYIRHEMETYIQKQVSKTSAHYSYHINKINKSIEMFTHKNIVYTENDIAIDTGLPLETVMQCLKINQYSNECSYDSEECSIDDNESLRGKSPEEVYLENEKNAILYNALKTVLSDENRLIICKRMGLGCKACSFKDIAEELNLPIDKIRKEYQRSIRKLRKRMIIKKDFNDYISKQEDEMINYEEIDMIKNEIPDNLIIDLNSIPLDSFKIEELEI